MRSVADNSANYREDFLGPTRCFFSPVDGSHETTAADDCDMGNDACLHYWLCVGLRSYDLLGVGLAVCDRECHVWGANRFASSLFHTGNELYLSAAGELCVAQRNGHAKSKVLMQAVRRAQQHGREVALLVRRSADKPALTLIVKSVSENGATKSSHSPFVLVLIIDPSLPQDTRLADLQRLYGFAPDQARLAGLLAKGLSLEQCCDELAIASSKACRQLRTMLHKLGFREPNELIALLNREGR